MGRIMLALFLGAIVSWPAPASAAATGKDFYNGRTVEWIISTGPGGGHDYYARLFARYMEKALPGSTFVNINRPGAGHVIGANLIYAAKPDGLTIGNFTTGLVYAQIQNLKGIRFDLAKMSWIGKGASDIRVLSVAHNSEYKTFKDVMATKRKFTFSASGVAAGSYMDSFMFGEAWKIPYRIIVGYQGPESALGMLRGETDGLFGGMSSGMEYVRAGQTRIILRFGETAQFADMMKTIPDGRDLAETPQQKALAKMMVAYGQLSRIIAGPPDIKPDRLQALRAAFIEASRDPTLMEEAKKSHRELEVADGETTAALVKEMLDQPPEIVAMLAALTKVKVEMVENSGKVIETKRGGRAIAISEDGKTLTAKVSGSRTKVTINGKAAKRKAVKVGMTCTFTWPRPNSEAAKIDCKE